jgi:hypothetical protein
VLAAVKITNIAVSAGRRSGHRGVARRDHADLHDKSPLNGGSVTATVEAVTLSLPAAGSDLVAAQRARTWRRCGSQPGLPSAVRSRGAAQWIPIPRPSTSGRCRGRCPGRGMDLGVGTRRSPGCSSSSQRWPRLRNAVCIRSADQVRRAAPAHSRWPFSLRGTDALPGGARLRRAGFCPFSGVACAGCASRGIGCSRPRLWL